LDIAIQTQRDHGTHPEGASAASGKQHERPNVAAVAVQRHKKEALHRLLQEQLVDGSDYGERGWPQMKQLIETNRLSPIARFCD
jgi:hypothetical protein